MTQYNESEGPHKYKGWYWCAQRQAFFRWTEFIGGLK
jgi:hypothetical protein